MDPRIVTWHDSLSSYLTARVALVCALARFIKRPNGDQPETGI